MKPSLESVSAKFKGSLARFDKAKASVRVLPGFSGTGRWVWEIRSWFEAGLQVRSNISGVTAVLVLCAEMASTGIFIC